MTVQQTPPSDSTSLPHGVHRFVEELAQLLETSPAPAEFHTAFLQRVLAGTQGISGAVWSRNQHGQFNLEQHINLAAVGLDRVPDGWSRHAEILQAAAHRERALWVPPQSDVQAPHGHGKIVNPTGYGLLLAPIIVDKEVMGLVEVWHQSTKDAESRRILARFVTELTGFEAAFFHKSQWRELVKQKKTWTQLEAFSVQIHGSLDLEEVSHLVANESRRLLECDQVSVAVRLGKTRVAAVSGVPVPEKRSRLIQAMQTLFDRTLSWGEKVVFQGSRDESLPPAVLQALDAYLAESNCKMLAVIPLRQNGRDKPGCALMAESFEPSFTLDRLQQRLEVITPHVTSALNNAVRYERMPLKWLSRSVAGFQDLLRGRRLLKVSAIASVVLLIIGLLAFIHIPLRMEAKGQLLPKDRQMVFATLNGKIVDIKVQHGDVVDKGQELLFVEDLETQLQVDQLAIKIGSAEQRLAFLSEQLGKSLGNEERTSLTRERINQEYELNKAIVERDLLLQGSRNPRKSAVVAPQAGKVVTFDAQEQLLGKTVKPGDPLVRIARVTGSWEIELLIPEGHIGPIREGLKVSPEGALDVDLLLASQPHRTYKGKLFRDGLGGETSVKDNTVVLPARVQVSDPDLIAQLESMPVGGEVRAKVNCGPHSLGRVWFFELWEFFYEHVLF